MNLVHATDISVDSKHIVGLSVDGKQIYNADMDYVTFNMTTPDDGTTCDLYKIDSKYVDNGELRLRLNANYDWNNNFLSTSHAINSQNAGSISSINVHSTKISSIGESCFDGFTNLKEFNDIEKYTYVQKIKSNDIRNDNHIKGFLVKVYNGEHGPIDELTIHTYDTVNQNIYIEYGYGISPNPTTDGYNAIIYHSTEPTYIGEAGEYKFKIEHYNITADYIMVFFNEQPYNNAGYGNQWLTRKHLPIVFGSLTDQYISTKSGWSKNWSPVIEIGYDKKQHIKKLGWRSFCRCTSLKDIQLNEVTEINGGAFFNCTNLSNIEFNKLSAITREQTFYGCTKLSTINLPSLKNILANETFKNCTTLTSINLPNLQSITGSGTFSNCNLISLDLPSLTAINEGTNTFERMDNCLCVKIENLSSINSNNCLRCFGNSNVKYFYLPELTACNHQQLFLNSTGTLSIDIPKLVTAGHSLFCNCYSLVHVNVDSLTAINNWGFENCSSLISIDLPNVTYIGEKVFNGCSNLTDIYLGYTSGVVSANVSTFGNIVGQYGHAFSVHVPESLYDQYVNDDVFGTLPSGTLQPIIGI